jgi:hypothetical protein
LLLIERETIKGMPVRFTAGAYFGGVLARGLHSIVAKIRGKSSQLMLWTDERID